VLDLQTPFKISKLSVDNFVDISTWRGGRPLKSRAESKCYLKKQLQRIYINQGLTIAISFVAGCQEARWICRTAA
jgi:hypothetical protein